jgi:hypothetical protein
MTNPGHGWYARSKYARFDFALLVDDVWIGWFIQRYNIIIMTKVISASLVLLCFEWLGKWWAWIIGSVWQICSNKAYLELLIFCFWIFWLYFKIFFLISNSCIPLRVPYKLHEYLISLHLYNSCPRTIQSESLKQGLFQSSRILVQRICVVCFVKLPLASFLL